MNANTNAQAVTLVTADHVNERYTVEEIDFIVAFTDIETDRDIALALGRSLYGIWAIQHRLRAGDYDALIRRARANLTAVRTCPTCFIAIPLALDACEAC